MENWEKQEGLIPQHELWKGFRGLVLWAVVTVVLYKTVSYYVFEILARQVFYQVYGTVQWLPEIPSLIFYVVNPVLKVVLPILLGRLFVKVLNGFLTRKNLKIEEKNAQILEKNLSDEGVYMGNQNLDENAKLQLRLQKGKMEVAKYEWFFKKLDFARSFYRWKTSYAVITGIVSYAVTSMAAYIITLVIAIAVSIVFLIIGQEAPQIIGDFLLSLVNILAIVGAVAVGIASMPFAKSMQKKADSLMEEDKEKGYTEAVNRVIWDVPARYRRRNLMNKLIRIVKKKKLTTVEEAIAIYERDLAIKKGITMIIYALIMFGIANAVNNWFDEWEADSDAIARDIGRSMDESRAESARIRETDRQMRELRNRAGMAQDYANRSRANAANLAGTNKFGEAAQWANHAQKGANAAWNDLNNFLHKK